MEKGLARPKGFDTAPTKFEWCLFIAITAVFFFQNFHFDIAVTTQQGMNFWECVRAGNILEFYNVNYGVGALSHFTFGDTSMYYLPLYLVFAVWSLPLWIFESVTGAYAMYSVPCVLWARAITIPFTYLAVRALGKLAAKLGMDETRARWCQFLFLTSNIFANAVVIIGQYDIISISFMLLGLLGYFEKNDKKFIGWFALAATFKLFALLIFIPLVLQRYKRIWPALWRCLVPLGAVALVRAPFEIYGGKGIEESSEISYSVIRMALGDKLPLANGSAPVFVVATIALWLWAFLSPAPDEAAAPRRSVWICLEGFGILLAGIPGYPYWNVLMLPYLTLLICACETKRFKLCLLLESAMSALWVASQMIYYPGCYEIRYLLSGLMPKLFGGLAPELYAVNPVGALALPDYLASDIYAVLEGAWVALFVALIILLFPRKKERELAVGEEVSRGIVWARIALGWIFASLPIALYIANAA